MYSAVALYATDVFLKTSAYFESSFTHKNKGKLRDMSSRSSKSRAIVAYLDF